MSNFENIISRDVCAFKEVKSDSITLHYVREFMREFMTCMFTLPGRDSSEEEGATC